MTSENRKTGGDGCGYLVMTCFITCCFLVLNCVLLRVGYLALAPIGPEFLRNPKIVQGLLFLGPLAMMFIQWWLVDRLRGAFVAGRQ